MRSSTSTRNTVLKWGRFVTLFKSVVYSKRWVYFTSSTWTRLHYLQIEHPFVVNMRYAFQDDENCFLVLDLMLGGDLRCKNLISRVLKPLSLSVYLDRQGGLPEAVVCFYVAQLSSAIQFLHDNNIMHRHVFAPFLLHKRNSFSRQRYQAR